MRLLVTGYGPFGSFTTNPSMVLAERCGRDVELLDVSYRFIDQWVENLDSGRFDALLLVGVDGGASRMRLENVGHNRIGRTPDVYGCVPRAKRIERGGPWRRFSTLWQGTKRLVSGSEQFCYGASAGGYLCNYVLYRSLARFPEKKVGFLHVPPFGAMSQETQEAALSRLLEHLERTPR